MRNIKSIFISLLAVSCFALTTELFAVPACTVEAHVESGGQCVQGNCQDGYGICTDNTKAYLGTWVQGKPNGQGRLLNEGSLVYEGDWADGKQNGLGTIYLNGKPAAYGRWENGEFVERKEKKKFIEDDGWGIAPGILYLHGWGKRDYIGDAEVSAFGVITITERLHRISRLFPSVYGYYRFKNNITLGFMLGVNEGVENKGRGFATAMGFAPGFRVGSGFFTLFFGFVLDPTVKRLPAYLKEGDFYPFLSVAQTDGSANSALLNSQIELPMETFLANYTCVGISYTFSLE